MKLLIQDRMAIINAVFSIIIFIFLGGLLGCSSKQSKVEDTTCYTAVETQIDATLSTAINDDGLPIEPSTVFNTDSKAILFTFWVGEFPIRCCEEVVISVVWIFETKIIDEWQSVYPGTPVPFSISLKKPQNSFRPGNYQVIIYADLIEKAKIDFIII